MPQVGSNKILIKFLLTWPASRDVDDGREVDGLGQRLQRLGVDGSEEAGLGGSHVDGRMRREGEHVAGAVVGHLAGDDRRHLQRVDHALTLSFTFILLLLLLLQSFL